MAKLVLMNRCFNTLIRRGYAVVATTENNVIRSSTSVVVPKEAVATSAGSVAEEASSGAAKEVYWMRDPKTGNWIPESHFDVVDVAELRNQLLSKKRH